MTSFSNFFIKKKNTTQLEYENEDQSNDNIDVLLAYIKKNGYLLTKVKSKNSIFKRNYYIDEDGLVIKYHGSQKSQCISNLIKASSLDDDILISHIEEIRNGANSDLLKNYCSHSTIKDIENQCFSLIYDGKTLDLIAETEMEKINFIRAIKYLINDKSKTDTSIWIKELFLSADLNNDKKLSIKEVVKLLNNLNIEMDEFNLMMFMNKEYFDIDDFVTFILRILRRKEVNTIFINYSGDKRYFIPEELQAFFFNEQKEDFDIKRCIEIIKTHEPVVEFKEKNYLTIDGFHSILTSDLMNILDPKCQTVYQDMKQPIVHYFIDSSHNTYLEGKQYNSKSKLESYIKALKSGCRCVELDVWDGQSEPEIFHGYANTTSLLFSDVIKTIDKYAFRTSKYPVILSIENHCSLEMQNKMASCIRSVFKEKLYTTNIRHSDPCPTPQDLIGKIIIKGKKINMESDDELDFDRHIFKPILDNEEEDFIVEEAEKVDEPEIIDKLSQAIPKIMDHKSKRDIKLSEASLKYKLSIELSDCVSILRTAKFIDFDHAKAKLSFLHVCSFSESKAIILLKGKYLEEFIHFNANVMSRIYPSGSRLKSSNYNPQLYWIGGCQIVALNYQTHSKPMFINKGLFLDNGGCGYVLKPKYQRIYNEEVTNIWKKIDIKIISGFALPKNEIDVSESILDPFIRVTLFDDTEDSPVLETFHVPNNGFNPNWDQTLTFHFRNFDMAIFLFEVFDYSVTTSHELVAQYSLPCRLMREGYRVIHLKNPQGHTIISQLLVHVTILNMDP